MFKIKFSMSLVASLLALSLSTDASASNGIDYPSDNYSVSYDTFFDGYSGYSDYNKPLAFLSFKIDFSVLDADPSENHGLFPSAIYDLQFRDRVLHLNLAPSPPYIDVRTWGLDSYQKALVEEGELSGNHYYYQTSFFFDLSGVDQHGQALNFRSNLEFYYACPSIGESLNELRDPKCFPQHLSPADTQFSVQNTTGPEYYFSGAVGRISASESASIPMLFLGLLGIVALRKSRTNFKRTTHFCS